MTANTTTVLPDTRAREVLKTLIPLAQAWMRHAGTDAGITGELPLYAMQRQAIIDAQSILATPPASDAAVSAGATFDVDDRGLFCRHCGRSSVRHHRVNGVGNFCEPAAAPKVASDTGAGLREALQRAAEVMEWLADNQPDCFGWEPPYPSTAPKIEIEAAAVRKALATDAADGATGGGEEVRGKIAALFCDEVRMYRHAQDSVTTDRDKLYRMGQKDALILMARQVDDILASTTPGGDLLEQAARVDGPAMERLATMADHGRIDAAYGNFSHPALTMIADVRKVLPCLRALSARNQTDDGAVA